MRIYAVVANSFFFDWCKRVGALHQSVYHGVAEYRTWVEWVSSNNDPGEQWKIDHKDGWRWRWPAVTNQNREPLHITRSGRCVPAVFGKSHKSMIVSPEVREALAGLPNVGFNTVVLEQLVDLAMPRLGDFSWYDRPDLDQYEIDPDNLLRSLPHDPSFEPRVAGHRQLLPALFDDLAPRYTDVETRLMEFGSYAHVTRPKDIRLSVAMLKDYPIVLSECFLFREDAFALIAPFLDLDYYAIAVISVRTDADD